MDAPYRGCQECRRSNALDGVCVACGRRWGSLAPEGVHRRSPCPARGMRGHLWQRVDQGPDECEGCKQRELSPPTPPPVETAPPSPSPSDPSPEFSQAFVDLCETYNLVGKQLVLVAELYQKQIAEDETLLRRCLDVFESAGMAAMGLQDDVRERLSRGKEAGHG